jgi:uncharacterized membrane protein YidH (DUF202 family)
MIRGYSDHAANLRTFLAWVRTGIAVIAFGFVIENFNLRISRHRPRPRRKAGEGGANERPLQEGTTVTMR